MRKYELLKNGGGYNMRVDGKNLLFIVYHNGVLYINTTPEQNKNLLQIKNKNGLDELFIVIRQIKKLFLADQIIIVNTQYAFASLLSEAEWGQNGYHYNDCGLLSSAFDD